jgi:hypothetical protein
MSRRRACVRAAAVLVLVWAACASLQADSAAAADAERQRRSLVGIGGVHVHIVIHGENPETHQLTDARLRPEVDSRLQAAGLRLLDVDASAREPGVPWLFVTLGTQTSTDTKAYAWSIRVELEQRTCLERDPTICESWPTWSTARFGSAGRRRVRTLNEEVAAAVDEFVAAYRAANGR